MSINFFQLTLEQRIVQSYNLRKKYTDRVPIIIKATKDIDIKKIKFLAPKDITLFQLVYSIRKQITNVKSTEALFTFINNIIPNPTMLISDLDDKFKDKDGFVYITITKEATFG